MDKLIADLHIHSKYSRATSKALDLKNLEKYAKIKGIDVLGTGDFTHPEWINEITSNLKDDGTGVMRSESGFPFILQTELSLIYTHNGRGRKVHNVLLAPDIQAVKGITKELLKRGRIDYDGRPIFKIPCPEFVEMLRDIDERIEVIPAHVWTPWFSVFGSNSGYDQMEDAFEDQTKHIHAIETGLSSDPPMNWRVSSLDKYQLLSNSDLHSFWPWRIGREANIFDIDLTYNNLLKAIQTGDGLTGTIEIDPSFGKYHYSGHRKCNIRFDGEESKKHNNICPVCKKPLTVGVVERIEELADRPEGFQKPDAKKFYTFIPLSELISAHYGKGVATQATWKKYNILTENANEMDILLHMSKEDIVKLSDEVFADIILKNRKGEIKVDPGYDGVYGIPQLTDEPIKTLEPKK